jgi:maleate isomerase
MKIPDYGSRGRFGLLTPQANPTVEPEFRRLMLADTELYTGRLTSRGADTRTRLVDYLEQLPGLLAQYDTLRLAAVAFACTGSSYLLGAGREGECVRAAAEVVGAPVETAAQAIRAALLSLQAHRIFIITPYPAWLRDAGVAYWQAAGVEVVGTADVPTGPSSDNMAADNMADTRGIYELQSADAAAVLEQADTRGADAVLLSGTGMPTLPLLRQVAGQRPPVLSSNLCLAWRLRQHVAGDRPGSPLSLLQH